MFDTTVHSQLKCKCCGAAAPYFGNVDFHRNCEERTGRKVLPASEISLPYYRCLACGFIFTIAMDRFTPADFSTLIYNDQYVLVDPEYKEIRPKRDAEFVAQFLGEHKSVSILDYGSGSGVMAQNLRQAGFQNVQCYDPFVAGAARRPQGQFDFILCVEVIEHSVDPKRIVADLSSLRRKPGVILLSTVLQPSDIDQIGLNWWYVAPRNGHVSLFSRRSLEILAASAGLRVASFNDAVHILGDSVPDYAARWFRRS